VLVLLALADGDAHGYSIRQQVLERSDGRLRLDPGSLYRAIGRLVDEGLIEESPETPADHNDDDRRRYYRLTPVGRRALAAEADRLEALAAQVRAAGLRRPRRA
jgi:DNA-binding PadR family transcriptional regulator